MSGAGLNTLVIGRTQSGKTYWTIRQIQDADKLIVYSTKREEVGYPGVYFDALEGGRVDFLQFWGRWERAGMPYRLVYRPADIFDPAEFDSICRLAYAAGNLTIVCEEVMTYATTTNIGPGFRTLLTAGATKGIHCYMLTQRPFKIPREITSQSRRAIIFATHEPADVEYIKQTFGTEAADRLAALSQYQHIAWDESGKVEVGKA